MKMEQAKSSASSSARRSRHPLNWRSAVAVLAAATTLAACSGKGTSPTANEKTPSSAAAFDMSTLSDTTPAGNGPVDTLRWNLFYEPTAIDPAHSLNYTETEVVSNLCDNLLRMKPDFTYEPGLATYTNPNPTTWVYKIHDGVKFWDGTPLTAEDVAYSLKRHMDPKVGSYWSDYFGNVKSIDVTGPLEVTVRLARPDSVFNQGMALSAGAVSEKKFDEAHGKSVGTPTVGVMCSGPYKFVSWAPGNNLTVVKNDSYWDTRINAKVKKIVFSFIGTDAAETNALTTGELDGMYETPISGTKALQSSSAGKLYIGKTMTQYSVQCIPHPEKADDPINNVYVRQALSLVIDRQAVAKTIFSGVAAQPSSKALFAAAGAASYGYAKDVFLEAAKDLPSLDQNLAEAKKLMEKAGNPTTPISIGYASDGPAYNIRFAQYLQSAAAQIGLHIKLNPMTTAVFNGLGFDKDVTEQTDISATLWFNELPDPVQWYRLFTPNADGSLSVFNYGRYQNPVVTENIAKASQARDDTTRAGYVVKAQKQIMNDLPWIPVVDLPNRLFMSNSISGAPASAVQLWYPWATQIGSTK